MPPVRRANVLGRWLARIVVAAAACLLVGLTVWQVTVVRHAPARHAPTTVTGDVLQEEYSVAKSLPVPAEQPRPVEPPRPVSHPVRLSQSCGLPPGAL